MCRVCTLVFRNFGFSLRTRRIARADMVESWRERWNRQAREMDAALRSALAAVSDDDAALRTAFEQLATRPRFAEFTWRWGPLLARRNRVLFRPFILAHFSSFALDATGEGFDAWEGKTGRALADWLGAGGAG